MQAAFDGIDKLFDPAADRVQWKNKCKEKRMKTVQKAASVFLTAVLIFSGCSFQPVSQESGQSIVVTDDLNREVSLSSPKNAAVLIGSFADLWIDAGGRDSLKAAAHDSWTSFDLDLDESVADLGDVKKINTEVLLASKPDLVIGSAKNESQLALKETLASAGIPALYYDVSSFDDYLKVMNDFTKLTGNKKAYEEKGTAQKERIESLKSQAAQKQSPKVLYIRAAGSGAKVKNSKGSVLGEMLKDLNAQNIADTQNALLENLSMETILQENPSHIFLVYQGSDDTKARKQMEEAVLSNPLWQSLDAVKNGKVHVMDPSLYNLKPNDKWADAYEGLYNILYEN